MPGVQTLAAGIVDSLSVPALAVVPANFRVTASGLPIGVIGDVVQFAGSPTLTGTWVAGSLRASINLNQPLIRNLLGLRVAGLRADERDYREGVGSKTERFYT